MNQDFDILNSFKKRRSFIVVCAILFGIKMVVVV